MFDQIPARVWLLVVIAMVAIAPGRYFYQYIAASPLRRDITQPSEDLSWRTSAGLVRSLAILAALAALAVFIFTPTAGQFARSPSFLPILMVGLGGWALYTVPRGLATGQVEPFVRGFNDTFTRDSQPRRYWASLTWNGLLGCLCIGLAYPMYSDMRGQQAEARCYYHDKGISPQDRVAACNALIGRREGSADERADALAGRASAYFRIGDYHRALIDNSNSIRLEPGQSYVRYNRALVYEAIGDRPRAVADYSEAIRLSPDDADAYLNRGLIFLDTSEYEKARADFTRAHELDPKDAWALANRGMTYAWRNDRARAEADFEAARLIDPSNPVVLRGEGLLAMNAGQFRPAVDRLTESLEVDPQNAWALALRAEAYRLLGEHEKASADRKAVRKLTGVTLQAH